MGCMEALIDFGEDEEIGEMELMKSVDADMRELSQEIERHLGSANRGERLRSGWHVVIAGAPNAGKSSLINCLARRQAAIVSPTAGTTRDIVEVALDVRGYPVIIADTAGIRDDAQDDIEQQGIRIAKERLWNSDMLLLVIDLNALLTAESAQERALQFASCFDEAGLQPTAIANKADLVACAQCRTCACTFIGDDASCELKQHSAVRDVEDKWGRIHILSCSTGRGVEPLLESIAKGVQQYFRSPQHVGGAAHTPGEVLTITRKRHVEHLQRCVAALHEFEECTDGTIDMRCEVLRSAAQHLGRITGRTDTESVLDFVFQQFCIGK